MIVWLRAFFYDEAAFQRYSVAGIYLLGCYFEKGGVIPGTNLVIGISDWTNLGAPLKALAFFLAAGGTLPSPK